jgi:hypothetical protein
MSRVAPGGRGSRATRAVAIVVGLVLASAVAACANGPGATGSASPGDSPTPAASVDGAALAASFVEILGDPQLHADVVQQATATADQAGDPLDFRVTMSGVLALPDVDLELAVEAEGQSTRFRIVVAGDQSFVDLGEGWVEAPPGSVDTSELTRALVVVSDPDDLEYVGAQQVDGRTLYHLVTTGPLPYTPAGFEGTGTGTGTLDDLDAYVEADGTPVRIQLSFTASGTTEAGAMTVNGTTEIRFADVGGDQVVAAPSIAPSIAPSAVPSSQPSAAP